MVVAILDGVGGRLHLYSIAWVTYKAKTPIDIWKHNLRISPLNTPTFSKCPSRSLFLPSHLLFCLSYLGYRVSSCELKVYTARCHKVIIKGFVMFAHTDTSLAFPKNIHAEVLWNNNSFCFSLDLICFPILYWPGGKSFEMANRWRLAVHDKSSYNRSLILFFTLSLHTHSCSITVLKLYSSEERYLGCPRPCGLSSRQIW